VDARIVAATNKDLNEEIKEGRFREDLFYRLNVVPIHVPPLRARREDIPLLAQHFTDRIGAEHGRGRRAITPEAMKLLSEYSWPGNIRELKNLIERLLIMTDGDSIGPDDVEDALPPDTGDGPPSEIKAARDKAERDAIHGMLRECQWNVSEAARRLGMDRGYLHRKIKRYGLARDGGA
jgi:two-component system nitrogen regulation response regulator NtrX